MFNPGLMKDRGDKLLCDAHRIFVNAYIVNTAGFADGDKVRIVSASTDTEKVLRSISEAISGAYQMRWQEQTAICLWNGDGSSNGQQKEMYLFNSLSTFRTIKFPARAN